MATTKFTVKCCGSVEPVVYYGYNCPREGEYIAFGGLSYRVLCVTHNITPWHSGSGWEEITIEVAEGRK